MAGSQLRTTWRVLEATGLELDASAVDLISLRVRSAPESPPLEGGGVRHVDPGPLTLSDDAAIEGELERSAERLASELVRMKPGPYSAADVELVLDGLCPIWPFC